MLEKVENLIKYLNNSKFIIVVNEDDKIEVLSNGKPIKGLVSIDFTAGVDRVPSVIIEKRVI